MHTTNNVFICSNNNNDHCCCYYYYYILMCFSTVYKQNFWENKTNKQKELCSGQRSLYIYKKVTFEITALLVLHIFVSVFVAPNMKPLVNLHTI